MVTARARAVARTVLNLLEKKRRVRWLHRLFGYGSVGGGVFLIQKSVGPDQRGWSSVTVDGAPTIGMLSGGGMTREGVAVYNGYQHSGQQGGKNFSPPPVVQLLWNKEMPWDYAI